MKVNFTILFVVFTISLTYAQQSEVFKKANTIIIETGEPESVAMGHVVRELRNAGYMTTDKDDTFIQASKEESFAWSTTGVIEITIQARVSGGTITMNARAKVPGYSGQEEVQYSGGGKRLFRKMQEVADNIAAPSQQYFAKQ